MEIEKFFYHLNLKALKVQTPFYVYFYILVYYENMTVYADF